VLDSRASAADGGAAGGAAATVGATAGAKLARMGAKLKRSGARLLWRAGASAASCRQCIVAAASRLRRSRLIIPCTPALVYGFCASLVGGTTAALSGAFEPHLVVGLPGPVQRACAGLQQVREQHETGCLLAHGLLTDAAADLLAQAMREHFARGAHAPMAINGIRAGRSTAVAMLSDDLPFLLWMRMLWEHTPSVLATVRASKLSPRLASVLTHPLGVAVGKTAVTQLVYETFSTSSYLALQAVLRGEGWRGALAELRGKFRRVWLDGFAFFGVLHVILFVLPLWWLQPMMDNLATLVFNTYLAWYSHESPVYDEEDEGARA